MNNTYRVNMNQFAMLYGTYLGLFWIGKFMFLPLGFEYQWLFLLYFVLTLYGPWLAYRFVVNFRDKECGGVIGYWRAWFFTLLIYVFAALLTAACHYIYFRFIDQGYIFSQAEMILTEYPTELASQFDTFIRQSEEALSILHNLSPLDITMQLISQNVYIGFLLAFPTALFAMRRHPKIPLSKKNQ